MTEPTVDAASTDIAATPSVEAPAAPAPSPASSTGTPPQPPAAPDADPVTGATTAPKNAAPKDTAPKDTAPEAHDSGIGTRFGLLLSLLALVWLVAKLWASYRQIRDAGGGSVALAAAAISLPAVVQSTMLAGLGGGLAARLALPSRARWLTAPAGGLLLGLLSLAAIIGQYGAVTSIVRVAVTVAAAGLLGGVLAAAPVGVSVVIGGLAAALVAFVLDTVLNSSGILNGMMSAFGGGPSASPAHIVSASGTVAHIDSLLVGVAAGVTAFIMLRRQGCRRFPSYQVAGAITGALLLLSEALVSTGGANLLDTARAISPADRTSLDLFDSARVINGLLVVFVGAIVALIAFGRTLPPKMPVTADDEPAGQRSS